MRRIIVPLDLGGSSVRCVCSPAPRPTPSVELIKSMIDRYREDRVIHDGDRLEVGFFHGGLPTRPMLEACSGLPIRVACSPSDLNRDSASWLVEHGADTIELNVLTFHERSLRRCRRGYTGRLAVAMLQGLGQMGIRVGVCLSPGMPDTTLKDCLADARILVRSGIAPVDYVRVCPLLVQKETLLHQWVQQGSWEPLTVGQAVSTSVELLEILEEGGVEVARVGHQPGPDLPTRTVGGPHHPNLRGLVEGRRFRERMARAIETGSSGETAILLVNPRDLSWAKGDQNANIRALRAQLGLSEITLQPDSSVARGQVVVG